MRISPVLNDIKYYICFRAKQLKRLASGNKKKYPTVYSIETVLGCNLECPECALGGNHITRKRGTMSYSRFKIIADKVKPYAKYMYLHIWGEPLLNKDIFRIIEYASKICRTNISTNGMLINEEIANKLIKSGVSDIIVSIDGYTQEVYERYRKSGNVEQAFLALEYLVKANKRYGNKAHIYPQFIVFKHNQAEMEDFKNKCIQIGVKPVFKAPYLRRGSCFEYPSINDYIRTQFYDRNAYEKAIRNCRDLTDSFTIDIDGNVVLCCYDCNSNIVFGNVFDQSVDEIYYGDKHVRFLESVKKYEKCPELCFNNCLSYVFNDGYEDQ